MMRLFNSLILILILGVMISDCNRRRSDNLSYEMNINNIQTIIFGTENYAEGHAVSIETDFIAVGGYARGLINGGEYPFSDDSYFLSLFDGNRKRKTYQGGAAKNAQVAGYSVIYSTKILDMSHLVSSGILGKGTDDLIDSKAMAMDLIGEETIYHQIDRALMQLKDMAVDNEKNIYLLNSGGWPRDENDRVLGVIVLNDNRERTGEVYYGFDIARQFVSIALDNDRNIYLAGSHYGSQPETPNANSLCTEENTEDACRDVVLCKFKSPGYIEYYCYQWGSSLYDTAFDLVIDDNKNAWIAGSTSGILAGGKNYGGWDAFLTKITPKGEMTHWQWGGTSDDRAQTVVIDHWGNVVVIGNTDAEVDGVAKNGLGEELFISHFKPDGTRTTRVVGGQGNEYVYDTAINEKGIIVATGRTSSKTMTGKESGYYSSDNQHAFLMILTPDYKDPALNNNPLYDPDNIPVPDDDVFLDNDSVDSEFRGNYR